MTIAARLRVVRGEIAAACAEGGRDPATVSLLPVSKRHPAAAILEAKAAGLMSFGESRVQELSSKGTELDGEGLAWHLIGSLQTNKVHQLVRVPGLVMVHSLDRIKLATALQVALSELDRKLAVLLQVDATGEANKHGVSVVEAPQLLECVVRDCPNLEPVGVMAMGPQHGDPRQVFDQVARLCDELRQRVGLPLPTLSLGMTGDMGAAIAAGSTMVRVGTGVFGPRPG